MPNELIIKLASPFDPEVLALIAQLDEYQQSLYPAESNHLDSPAVLAEPNCRFMGAYIDGKLVGIGAAKIAGTYGELKRFFVPESQRGKGIAECIIGVLEKWLMENKIFLSQLETGIHQPAAIRFYQKLGYEMASPFGGYKPDPLSVFMTKDLTKGESAFKSREGQ
ncbi:MAG: GNAT family N-acetyltransferase [Pseudobdellovibrionaceae bacterium]